MTDESEIKSFVDAVRAALPEAAAMTDQLMSDRGFDPDDELHYIWVEALADVTNGLIRNRRQKEVDVLFRFFSDRFDKGTEHVKRCIDVSFVENLMWDLETADKKWAWPMLPENLRKLHIVMWGELSF